MIPPDQALRLVVIEIACSLGNGGGWQVSGPAVFGEVGRIADVGYRRPSSRLGC
jgi:hypothetical protein